jgi:hypothetical protein
MALPMFKDDMDFWQFVCNTEFYALIEVQCISGFILTKNVAMKIEINDAKHHNINNDKHVFE